MRSSSEALRVQADGKRVQLAQQVAYPNEAAIDFVRTVSSPTCTPQTNPPIPSNRTSITHPPPTRKTARLPRIYLLINLHRLVMSQRSIAVLAARILLNIHMCMIENHRNRRRRLLRYPPERMQRTSLRLYRRRDLRTRRGYWRCVGVCSLRVVESVHRLLYTNPCQQTNSSHNTHPPTIIQEKYSPKTTPSSGLPSRNLFLVRLFRCREVESSYVGKDQVGLW